MLLNKKSFISAAIATAVMSGCGVKQASSPSNPIVIPEAKKVKELLVPKLNSDDQTNFLFTNNKVFIWKDHSTLKVTTEGNRFWGERTCDQKCLDATSHDIKLALEAGQLNDKLDDEAKPYYKQKDELKIKKDTAKTLQKSLEQQVKNNKKAQKAVQAQLDELAKIQPPTPESEAKILVLKDQQIQLKSEGVALIAAYDAADAEYKSKQAEFEIFDQDVQNRFDKPIADATRPLMEALGTDAFGNDNWYKDMPSRVVFRFETNGTLYVEVKDWTVDGKEKQYFSTENGLIRDVTYEEKGGVFRFKLDNYKDNAARTDLIATYTFELARARYEQTAKDGRLFMAGEFTRDAAVCDLAKEPCKRKGSAKLASY